MSDGVAIEPNMVTWARERVGMSVSDLAQKIGVEENVVKHWESPKTKNPNAVVYLDWDLADRLSRSTGTPILQFLLDKPMRIEDAFPNFIRINKQGPAYRIIDLQDWYRDYKIRLGCDPLEHLGKIDFRLKVNDCGIDNVVRSVSVNIYSKFFDSELMDMVEILQAYGINVIMDHFLRRESNNLLGFAMYDPIAPFIIFNPDAYIFNPDAYPHEQVCSLIGSMACLWVGVSSVITAKCLGIDEYSGAYVWLNHKIEDYYTRVIKEVLFMFSEKHFQDMKYYCFKERYRRNYNEGPRGCFYDDIIREHGRLLVEGVLREALGHKMLLRHAGQLIGLEPSKLKDLADYMGLEI